MVAFFELYSLTASYSHLKNVYSSLKFLHKAMNLAFIEEEFQVNTILQSLKRKLSNVPFQVLPITPQILKDLYNFIDINIPADLALWSSFLVAFYCLFRKANVSPKNIQKFDPNKELSRKKLCYVPDLNVILVYSNFSKTNQFMSKEIVIPLCQNGTQSLDPVFHLRKVLAWNLPENSPAFSYIDNGLKCVTYASFTFHLKCLLSLAGYAPEMYSGHSFRRGVPPCFFSLIVTL